MCTCIQLRFQEHFLQIAEFNAIYIIGSCSWLQELKCASYNITTGAWGFILDTKYLVFYRHLLRKIILDSYLTQVETILLAFPTSSYKTAITTQKWDSLQFCLQNLLHSCGRLASFRQKLQFSLFSGKLVLYLYRENVVICYIFW